MQPDRSIFDVIGTTMNPAGVTLGALRAVVDEVLTNLSGVDAKAALARCLDYGD